LILILTPYSFKPLHPRLEYIEKYLSKNGYIVKKYNLKCENRVIGKLNWLSLTFFQVPSFFKSIKYLWRYRKESKILYLQDLQYLPISILAKIFDYRIIYDTLDNNVELNFYHISNRFKFLKKLSFIKRIISFMEKKMSDYLCDEIVVNSKALVEYFEPNRVNLIYYTSPFENRFNVNIDKEMAFLYLGGFWKMKGADIILDFIEKCDKKLYIYGSLNIQEKDILLKIDKLKEKGLVSFTNRLSSIELNRELEKIFKNYKLIGFSLTQEVNKSNATQEINKDIDYLAMGIPLIANYRIPTKEKIDAGCGVFIDDDKKVEQLLSDKEFYKKLSSNCLEYYNQNYAQDIFEKRLLRVIENVQ
jgi:glycosyltransferase involved in cell wall biosynthesis